MHFPGRRPVILIIVAGAAVLLFFLFRQATQADLGPTIALCPGPDGYGYSCESGAGFAYIDATQDTLLYEDDAVTTVPLPFPFLYYGTTYGQLQVSSNGNLQFGSGNPDFFNVCLAPEPAADMGDMIAPLWDDLDLRAFGTLDTETIGTSPDRIFVVEWDDVPRYGSNGEDRVTFEVQLFEKSGDVVFLYEDVTTLDGYNGSRSTIGLQSEAQASAIQYGCNQPVVADASGIHFTHPQHPPDDYGLDQSAVSIVGRMEGGDAPERIVVAKGPVLELLDGVNGSQPQLQLEGLRDEWLRQAPMRFSSWRWADLSGNGREDLVLIWRGDLAHPELDQLVVLESQPDGTMRPILQRLLSARRAVRSTMKLEALADFTRDGLEEVLLWDATFERASIITAGAGGGIGEYQWSVPCQGSLAAVDQDGDGVHEVVGNQCESGNRISYSWDAEGFIPVTNSE